MLPSLAGCSQADGGANQGIYYKEVPATLTASIESRIQEVSATMPLSVEARDNARAAVKGIVRKGRYQNIREKCLEVKKVGDGALPVVVDLLSLEDDAIRANAMIALAAFAPPPGRPLSKRYVDRIEPILVALCQRSLLDKNVDVRERALGGLDMIGHRHYRQIPEGVVSGIEQALSDPDHSIRTDAQEVKKHLGLAPLGPFDGHF